jgi:4-aminobutyrate aminotransferase
VTPDIICTAKGIASGLPLGAVIAKTGVMQWPPGTHASTFGGNPVACAAALATLDLLEGGLIENARVMGELITERLTKLSKKYPVIHAVRGRGLMVGAEFASHGRPAIHERDALLHSALGHGLLLLSGGESVVRMCPPLTVTPREIDIAFDILGNSLDEVLHERRAA